MELTGKMEEFMNDLIGERMEQVYQEKDGQQYDPFNEKLEMKLQKIFQKLSDKQRTILFDYMTETSNKCSDLNEFYYRIQKRKLLGKISRIFCRSADNARNQPLGILNI